ncbi:hypothetical protein BAUCODRAFT_53492, partial [Baudoinia panamericana UAMH 10762]
MAYSPEAVRAKLTSLNETQDSIVATSQWLLFHRRHAPSTAQLWLAHLQTPTLTPAKRLNLIYLVNEVVQQSRARGKTDFVLAFEPIIAEATASAYKGANESVQGKIGRVVEVWRQRGVFERTILDAVEARLEEVRRAKGGKSGGRQLGGTLFGGTSGSGNGVVPVELEGVAKSLASVTKADVTKTPAVENAEREFQKVTDASAAVPSPPVHAARLSALLRSLATAQGAVEASVRARRELLAGLERLVQESKVKLAEDEATMEMLGVRKEGIEVKKREVEDGIMRGLSNPSSPVAASAPATEGLAQDGAVQTNGNGAESTAPEAESFTPPPPEIES